MTADGERKGFELALESRRSLLVVSVPPTEGEGGGENMLDSRGVRLWADGVMNTSSGPPAENNNHNEDYNNDDNKKPEMSPATAASGGVPNEHS